MADDGSKIVELGRATRFGGDRSPVVKAAPKRGRPPKKYRDQLIATSNRIRNFMLKVVTDPTHEWHDEFGPQFARDLLRVCTPRLTEVTGKDGGPVEVDAHALIFGTMKDVPLH